jgi:multiple sugar transport system permease protein
VRTLEHPRAIRAGELPVHGRLRAWPFTPLLYVGPALAVLGLVLVYPVLQSIWLAFFDSRLVTPDKFAFVGAANFATIGGDAIFRQALITTILFTTATVACAFCLGLAFALLVDDLPGRWGSLRGLLLAPWVTPAIVVGFLFLYMFDLEVGVVNLVLGAVTGTRQRIAWLSNANLSMVAVVVANVWSQTPLFLLMFAAALTTIPNDQKESMRLDGATAWGEFRYLTLPYLRNIMVVASLLMVIRNFNNFPVIWTMTQGGPVYATTTLIVYIYRLAFQQFNFGYSSAVGVVWLLVLLALAVLYVRLLRREPLA